MRAVRGKESIATNKSSLSTGILQRRDNHAEYERKMTRGVPREGKALLAGLLYCGECSHKMEVRYSGATRYLCASLKRRYGGAFCQNLPVEPVDAAMVEAFVEALCPVELNLYEKAMATRQEMASAEQARRQQLERLHYQAELARSRFERGPGQPPRRRGAGEAIGGRPARTEAGRGERSRR